MSILDPSCGSQLGKMFSIKRFCLLTLLLSRLDSHPHDSRRGPLHKQALPLCFHACLGYHSRVRVHSCCLFTGGRYSHILPGAQPPQFWHPHGGGLHRVQCPPLCHPLPQGKLHLIAAQIWVCYLVFARERLCCCPSQTW